MASLNLTQPGEGAVGWASSVNLNFASLQDTVQETLSAQAQDSGTSLSYTVPANTLNTNFQALEFLAWGLGDSSMPSVTVSFGGSTIASFTVAASNTWFLQGVVLRFDDDPDKQYTIVSSNSYQWSAASRSTTNKDLAADPQVLQVTAGGSGITNVLVVKRSKQP